ncbi:MAG TPA: arsenosugar biosynthesis radical SAM (seleno)protein ArsS [Candidatus Binatia bacterium]|nr:arsenosugar biosynthesis radical SAM (seleno)protein ArsS [Candidatus Binatia bacterium]
MGQSPAPDFAAALGAHGLGRLRRAAPTTLQVNVGKRCNQACHHCHVDAGPKRTEVMTDTVAERIVTLLEGHPSIELLDVTGGAPELAPCFRMLVSHARRLGRRVIDRCNLTVLLEPGHEDLASFLAAHGVEIVASLPCYGPENVDAQRGPGVFERSIRVLRVLNGLGYGTPGSPLRLDLVYNPVGAHLPPPQEQLEADYRSQLSHRFGITFHRLLTITNMPINRFADQLARWGAAERYMALLVNHFNPATVDGLMCRTLVSVGYDGRLYDCDFNQMLELPLGWHGARTVWDLDDVTALDGATVATGSHCFGCTAGAGSSCGGALA